jgi:hypothetical protein
MPPSQPGFSPSGYLGGGGSGSAQTSMSLDITTAFHTALQSIQAIGGTIQAQQSPSLIRFEMSKRNVATTLGAKIRFDCEVLLSPAGPRQTAARVTAKLSSSGSTTLMGMCAGLAVLFWWTAISVKAPLWGVIGTAGAAGSYWMVSGKGPGEMVQRIVNALMSVQPMTSPPPLAENRTPPLPFASSPAESRGSASVGGNGNVFEQLKQLGALRDAGIVTGDEFEIKKADLLKRL